MLHSFYCRGTSTGRSEQHAPPGKPLRVPSSTSGMLLRFAHCEVGRQRTPWSGMGHQCVLFPHRDILGMSTYIPLACVTPIRSCQAYKPLPFWRAYKPFRFWRACKPLCAWHACKPLRFWRACKPLRSWRACKPLRSWQACKPLRSCRACKPLCAWHACKALRFWSVCKPLRCGMRQFVPWHVCMAFQVTCVERRALLTCTCAVTWHMLKEGSFLVQCMRACCAVRVGSAF
eukprot:jgi/Botrbrau1/8513/Bobra.0029s0017.1